MCNLYQMNVRKRTLKSGPSSGTSYKLQKLRNNDQTGKYMLLTKEERDRAAKSLEGKPIGSWTVVNSPDNRSLIARKVYTDIYSYIPMVKIVESDTRTSFWIDFVKYIDFEDVVTRYINKMNSMTKPLLDFEYFTGFNGIKEIQLLLAEWTLMEPDRIHYVISPCFAFKGHFFLSWMVQGEVRQKMILVRPDCYEYWDRIFRTLPELLDYHKIKSTSKVEV